jgi:hypothetical protein
VIQIVSVNGVNSLSEYVKNQSEIKIERPERCQNSECDRSSNYWKHTGYERWAKEGELSVVILVERFLCKYCGLVISCLFDFLIPQATFSIKQASEAVQRYAGEEVSYRSVAEETATTDDAIGDGGPSPSHAQVFRWVARLASQAKALLVHMQRVAIEVQRELHSERAIVCPNSRKAFSADKGSKLDALLKLLVQSGVCSGGSEVGAIEWLHRYFLQSRSFWRSILSGRKLKLSAQQRM